MPDPPSPPVVEPDSPPPVSALSNPLSAMTPRFNLIFRSFAKRYFRHFGLDPDTVEKLKRLEGEGSVVYVMRYASRLDYFLFNALFHPRGAAALGLRQRDPLLLLPTAGRAVAHAWWQGAPSRVVRPRGTLAHSARELVPRRRLGLPLPAHGACGCASAGGARPMEERAERTTCSRGGERGLGRGRTPVYVVPLAIFWRKGPRTRRALPEPLLRRATRPSDLSKVTSFLTTYRDLAVKVGEPDRSGGVHPSERRQGPPALARKVRRTILTFLYREEKVGGGADAAAVHRACSEMVVGEPRVQAAMQARAEERDVPLGEARAEAEKMFREIAANMNSTFLAILNTVVGSRSSSGCSRSIEISGLEKVAEYAKRHPIVLVPSHRSYFDFLILSMDLLQRTT